MPGTEFAMFERNIQYALDMVSTATALQAQVTAALSVDDLYRAALVQGVSAFDHFIHEEVRARMLAIQSSSGSRPSGFSRFRVTLDSVKEAAAQSGVAWLDSEIREQHGHLSFQNPDKVADAIRLVSDCSLWESVGQQLQMSAGDVRREIKLIVDRRNKIAHEADTDPTPPRSRYPISAPLVSDSLGFLHSVGKSIYAVI